MENKIQKLEKELKEEKEVSDFIEYLSSHKGDIVIFIQLNKCMSDNQQFWRERVGTIEKKMDLTTKQKDLVSFMNYYCILSGWIKGFNSALTDIMCQSGSYRMVAH